MRTKKTLEVELEENESRLKKLRVLSRQIPSGSPRQYEISGLQEGLQQVIRSLRFVLGSAEAPDIKLDADAMIYMDKRGQIFSSQG